MVVRLTEPYGSVVRPNLTEPPSSAEPDPDPERFGRSLLSESPLEMNRLSDAFSMVICSMVSD